MPSRTGPDTQEGTKKLKNSSCTPCGPGPKYQLRNVTGYKDHCHTKLREPAYTFGLKLKSHGGCAGPGPKYSLKFPQSPGVSFPKAKRIQRSTCTPGPYLIQSKISGPAFSITPKRKTGGPQCTPGPYLIRTKGPCHATVIGIKTHMKGQCLDPPFRLIGPPTLIRPKEPAYSFGLKNQSRPNCVGPGPKYYPIMRHKAPAFSFGLKHSDCSPPPRTECDEKC